jgi:hypothetical protein
MIELRIKFFVGLLMISCFISHARPLNQQKAQISAAAGGVILGGVAGATTYFLLNSKKPIKQLEQPKEQDEKQKRRERLRALIAVAVALGFGGLTWWGLSEYLFAYTPLGKYQKTSKRVLMAELDSFVKNNFDDDQAIIKHVNSKYGTNWPLVLGRNDINCTITDLRSAEQLLKEAIEEIQVQEDSKDLLIKCNTVHDKIPDIIKTLEDRMMPIINHEQYVAQATLYEKHVEAERQREFECKQRQKQLDHQRWEHEKDRDFKKRVLLSNNHKVSLNI